MAYEYDIVGWQGRDGTVHFEPPILLGVPARAVKRVTVRVYGNGRSDYLGVECDPGLTWVDWDEAVWQAVGDFTDWDLIRGI